MIGAGEDRRPAASPQDPDAADVEPRALRRLAAAARAIAADDLAEDALRLAERAGAGRFFVACVGQYKRGKSTLINALLGAPALPVGVAPVTSVVTVVRHGDRARARVRTLPGEWAEIDVAALTEYVAESGNPGNVKQIVAVEVFWPSPFLASGMCLVDTPGIGSVVAENTEATRDFLPHVDAALVVLGADPPISGEELELTRQIASAIPDVTFVIAKADRLPPADVAEARAFTERVLASSMAGSPGPVLVVSAAERTQGAEPTRDWGRLEERLRHLAERGRSLAGAAERRGESRIARRLLHRIDEQIGALERPIEASERRIAALRASIAEAERSLRDLGVLLAAEQGRIAARFAAEQAAFVEREGSRARADVARRVASPAAAPMSVLRADAFREAREKFHAALERWRPEQQAAAEAAYAETVGRFVEMTNAFLDRLASSGAPGVECVERAVAADARLVAPSHLVVTELLRLTGRSPVAWLRDVLLPRAWVRRRIARDAGAYLDRLFESNASRVKHDLDDQVAASRRQLEAQIRAALDEAQAAAERALALARRHVAEGRGASERALGALRAVRRDVVSSTAEAAGGTAAGAPVSPPRTP